ncbi:MAG: tail fiber protein [Alistipes senegalensis]|nr:tail fiber protein [Alistipes senegalensis]
MERNGDILTIADYPDLFAILGNLYGGNGTTTFALPDDRGLVERGWDHGRGYDSARTFGSEQQDATRELSGYIDHLLTGTGGSGFSGCFGGKIFNHFNVGAYGSGNGNVNYISFSNKNVVDTAPEFRMRNRAYLPIIKVLP